MKQRWAWFKNDLPQRPRSGVSAALELIPFCEFRHLIACKEVVFAWCRAQPTSCDVNNPIGRVHPQCSQISFQSWKVVGVSASAIGEGDGSSIACLNAPDPQKVIGAGNPQASDYSTGADTHKFLVHQLAYNGDVAADQLAVFKARAKCPYLD